MEVHLQPEKEAQLAQIAAQRGLSPDELAQRVISLYLEDDKRFIEAVNAGIATADRGDFVEHKTVGSNRGIPPDGGLGSAIAAIFAKHRSEIGEDDDDFEIPEFKGYEVKDPFSEEP
jgi:predicted transcriptional regulator